MSELLVPEKTDLGWVVEIPSEMAQALGIEEGSIAVLYGKDGNVRVEILPPPSSELLKEAQETYAELKDTFAELKRLGD
ncbi:MAG TPA: hypothetical protein VFY40_17685 [Blastocatellia bacterium]|nr:hypothetical protein [Blastocatellia bacterium]